MDLLEDYDNCGQGSISGETIKLLPRIQSEPSIKVSTNDSSSSSSSTTLVLSNLNQPSRLVQPASSVGRTLVGTVSSEKTLDAESFHEQFLSYERSVGQQRMRAVLPVYGNGGRMSFKPSSSSSYENGGGSKKKRARLQNNDASSDHFLGPWGGYEGEEVSKESNLERGDLSLKQKLVRVELGLNPDGQGKLEGEALEKATKHIKSLIAIEKEEEEKKKTMTTTNKQKEDGRKGSSTPSSLGAELAAKKINHRALTSAKDVATTEVDEASSSSSSSSSSSISKTNTIPASAGNENDDDDDGHQKDESVSTPAYSSTFHGKEEFDYQGRSWAAVPKGVHSDDGDHECFVPKKVLQRWPNAGGGKGVQNVSFFPGTGHLMLSSSLDGKLKVWDVMGTVGRPLRRTYAGHSAAVRDARFDLDGGRIASVSFDRHVNVWDTESGERLNSIHVGKTKPYCMAWSPSDKNALIVGTSKRRIVQYDLRTGEIAIEYDHHLSTVNTITFFDDGKKFVSTGDDKKVLVWEFNTPVPIKYITDPTMHVINAVSLHPSGQFFVGQSMDNTLQVYACGEKIGRVSKKVFKGHITAGYACQPSFSPDGHFLSSGDGEGMLWTWDWRTGRVLSKNRAHESGPCIASAWHPLIPSWVATGGWDGTVALHQ
jgi:pre-mRNA-processing factor 17